MEIELDRHRPGEVALCTQHEEMSSDLQLPMEQPGVLACTCNLSTGEWRQKDSWSFLANQPSQNHELQVH